MTDKSTDGISITRATAEDAAVIHQLLTDLEAVLDVKGSVQRNPADILHYGFSEKPLFEAIIAWQGKDPVGLAVYFSEFSTWRGSPGVYVQDLYVSPGVQGSGLGRRLMETLMEHARSWGATYCKLAVYGQNENALRFYRHLGFQVSENETVLIFRS